MRAEMMVPPSSVELCRTLGKLKGRKAAGENGILPEMVKCGGVECFAQPVPGCVERTVCTSGMA